MVLDHTSHLRLIECGPKQIKVWFNRLQAFDHAERHWNLNEFHLVTYHVGCGNEYNGQRSYYLVKNAKFDPKAKSVTLDAKLIDQEDALVEGRVTWGTYQDPEHHKRNPAKSHIRLSRPEDKWRKDPKRRQVRQVQPINQRTVLEDGSALPEPADSKNEIASSNGRLPTSINGAEDEIEEGEPVNLDTNVTALINFFGTNDFDLTDYDEEEDPNDRFGFIDTNGTVLDDDEKNKGVGERGTRRLGRSLPLIDRPPLSYKEKRFLGSFFKGLFEGIKKLVNVRFSTIFSDSVDMTLTYKTKINRISLATSKQQLKS